MSPVPPSHALIASGAALGLGNAPLLVRRAGNRSPIRRVAVPGVHTTANALMMRLFPRITERTPLLFSQIAAAVERGDTIVSTSFSRYFPAGILIGTVEEFDLNETRTAYTVRVRLAAEMSRLNEVVLVGNRDFYEIRNLQQSEQIEQHTRPE